MTRKSRREIEQAIEDLADDSDDADEYDPDLLTVEGKRARSDMFDVTDVYSDPDDERAPDSDNIVRRLENAFR